jgi:hypothetical protein
MRNPMSLVALMLLAGLGLAPVVPAAQAPAVRKEALARSKVPGGLEIAVLAINSPTRHDQFGQPMTRAGSCPPGQALQGLDLIVPGPVSVVTFTIRVLASYDGKAPSDPPIVIDAAGTKHRPHSVFILPNAKQLTQLKGSSEELNCEFPFVVASSDVKVLEFAGGRMQLSSSAK